MRSLQATGRGAVALGVVWAVACGGTSDLKVPPGSGAGGGDASTATGGSAGSGSGGSGGEVPTSGGAAGASAGGGGGDGGSAGGVGGGDLDAGAGGADVDASAGGTSGGGAAGDGGPGAGGASSGGAPTDGGSGTGGASSGGAPGDGGSGGADVDAGAGGTTGIGGADAGAGVVALTVDVTANTHPISSLIYGVNAPKLACDDATARFTLCRLGGNPWSTYDWENNASNAGGDRCFENDDALGVTDTPAATVTSLVDQAGENASLLTVPMLDYVAADKNGGSAPPSCSGDVRNSGANFLDTRFKHNRARKGSALSPTPDTTDAYVNQDEFVSYVKAHAPAARVLFAMDNQPELWSYTHLPVHPDHTTYAEVVAKNAEFSAMVKDTWPGAETTGAVGWGYQAFLDFQLAPDQSGQDFISFYLDAMKKAGDTAGRRLIDYLDLHWYSAAQSSGGVLVTDPDTTPPDPAVVAARVQAPRSLWDSTYKENSWIANDKTYGPVDLIHWFTQRIGNFYPGTKLAFSSWAYGGNTNVSGAVAAADVLGIFGRESIGLAAVEPEKGDNSYLVGAFAAFRNYDGAGAAFGDTSVLATTSDVARVSVYGSTDSTNPDRVVVIVINRSGAAVDTTLTLSHAAAFASADVYQIVAGSPVPTPGAALTATGNVFTFSPPAYSVSVVVPKP
ncbi:MAG TPA: glycoside hydrolase family 44 protein [Polyangiaceae bacterium]|nr:glycoside hydrolase family 44 protein [Polyangiaceae bacterium]